MAQGRVAASSYLYKSHHEGTPPVPPMTAMHVEDRASFGRGLQGPPVGSTAISEPPLKEMSRIANWLNNAQEVMDSTDVVQRSALFKPLAALMEANLEDASATDLSRLAWLHLHSGDRHRALDIANMGLRRDSENIQCQRLAAKLGDIA